MVLLLNGGKNNAEVHLVGVSMFLARIFLTWFVENGFPVTKGI